MDVGGYLRENFEVTDVSLGDSVVSGCNSIKIDRQYYSTISADAELGLALDKRFKSKHTLYRAPDYKELVWLCLSTDGYKVSSSSLNSVSDEDVSMAWQFIDTVSVSSTKRCREMTSLGKGGRNGAGFLRSRAALARQKPKPRANQTGMSFSGPPTVLTAPKQYSSEHDTIEEAMVEDCMRWVLESSNPTLSAMLLRSNILRIA